MNEYLTKEISRILAVFDDYSVVLVEVSSHDPTVDGLIYAITANTGGYPSIHNAEAAGFSDTDSIGVTAKCIELMQLYEKTKNIRPVVITKCNYKKCLNCGMVFSEIYEACPKCKKSNFEQFTEEIKPQVEKEVEFNLPSSQFWGLLFMIAVFTFIILSCFVG